MLILPSLSQWILLSLPRKHTRIFIRIAAYYFLIYNAVHFLLDRDPTPRPSLRPTKKPYPKPSSPAPTVLEPVETPEPTVYYVDDTVPTMEDPLSNPTQGSKPSMSVPDNSFPGFPGDAAIPGQFRKEVDEQCEQIVISDVCVERCVTVTSIFQGTTLIDESSTVTESSCLSKRQEAKQNQ